MQRIFMTACACAAILTPAGAFAQGGPPAQEGWSFSAGPAVLVRPEYEGADTYDITPLPGFLLTYDDWFFVDPARGLGAQGQIMPGLSASGGIDYMFGRDEDDSARLRGMGDLNGGLSGFGSVSFQPIGPILSLDARIEAPFTGGVSGAEILTDVVGRLPLGGGFVSASFGAAWLTSDMMDDLFGVTPAQSAASLLPAYDPDGGQKAWRASVSTVQPLGDRWTAVGIVGYDRLTGDAADSPIVQTRDQVRVIASALYRF